MVSICNVGGAVYLKTKVWVSFPRAHVMGKPSTAPPYVSIGIESVFYTGLGVPVGVTGGYCSLLCCECHTLHVLALQARENLTSDDL